MKTISTPTAHAPPPLRSKAPLASNGSDRTGPATRVRASGSAAGRRPPRAKPTPQAPLLPNAGDMGACPVPPRDLERSACQSPPGPGVSDGELRPAVHCTGAASLESLTETPDAQKIPCACVYSRVRCVGPEERAGGRRQVGPGPAAWGRRLRGLRAAGSRVSVPRDTCAAPRPALARQTRPAPGILAASAARTVSSPQPSSPPGSC